MTKTAETPEAFEARMIAQFNQRVNQQKIDEGATESSAAKSVNVKQTDTKEHNGPQGLEPTRYGDWEAKGRCHDF